MAQQRTIKQCFLSVSATLAGGTKLFQIRLWRYCFQSLRANNAMEMSSALSFRTIFALVPALVLVFTVASSLHIVDTDRTLRHLLDAGGFSRVTIAHPAGADSELGTSGKDTAADWIMSAVESVQSKLTLGRIGPIGLIVLIWTALTLLTTVEQSLNRIFEAPRSRPFLKRMLLYWSAVTLVPLIIAAAGYAADVAANALRNMPVLHFIVSVAGGVSNFVVGLIALGVIYKVMPNTRTHFRASAGGAFVAMILWVIVGWGFAIYVRKLVGPRNIYGTLGLLPLSLFWLNLVWLIFLFGAQLSFTWANLRRMEAAELARTITVGPVELLAGALVVARHYAAGSGPIAFDQIVSSLGLPGQTVHQIMQHLISLGLVYPVEVANEDQADQKYLLAEPTERISVLAVTAFLPASDTQMQTSRFDPWVAKRVAHVESRLRSKLGDYTLADVLAESDG